MASILLSAGVGLVSHANAQGRIVAQAYEVRLTDLQIAADPTANVTFRSCAGCAPLSIPAAASTRYSINGIAVRRDEFRAKISQASDEDASITILHHLDSDTIESIDASL